ncbi:MAG TPA: long-chain fatty acid--CoA ligase [Desulfobulbus sp.]|nr:long-chain fatty acid--CoA ligase [Desulfobulbus sp.]
MNRDIQSFADVYNNIHALPENTTFVHHRESDRWKRYSTTEFLTAIRFLTLAFAAEGWRGRQVAIAIAPSVDWLLLDYALMLCGAVSVPLFTNISTKNLRFQIDDADLHIVFTQTRAHEEIIHEANPAITCIDIDTTDQDHRTLETFLRAGQEINQKFPTRFDEILSRIRPDDLATIVYTSGTSGLPKGVELTHYNLISQLIDTAVKYKFDPKTDIALSLLPLAHIFERMVMHFYLSTGMSIYFADDVKNIGNLMHSVRPTVMTVVPRLLEKVWLKMHAKAMQSGPIKKIIAMWAFHRARHNDPYRQKSRLDSLLDSLVYRKLRDAMGGRIRMLISGGAPLSDDLYRFFLNIGIPLYQGYGLTEASPVICANAPGANKVGTCGRHFAHTEAKIDINGELLARGPGIMRGYHNNPQATRETIDSDGWLHTGDLATMDEDGYITITGRSKELSKTSTGEYISTSYIEQLLMASGWFDHVMTVGNNRPFVVALLMLDENVVHGLMKKHDFQDPQEAVHSGRFRKKVHHLIARINKKLNHWERIRNFHLITEPLSIENGDLTPSMKLAREHIQRRFQEEIEQMYTGE